MNVYPHVHTEMETLECVCAGASIGRYGDGELKLMLGHNCVSQKADDRLQEELRYLLRGSHTKALMGIPTLVPGSPKLANWTKLASKFLPFLWQGREYYSAFITRPDSAPWINTEQYFDKVQSLWKGQAVVFVGNNVRSLKQEFLLETGATKVFFIECPYRDAYSAIDQLERDILCVATKRVILCAGPTATCLASRLAAAGKHAIDLGHIGMFWRRYEQNTSWKEQREINLRTGKVEKNP